MTGSVVLVLRILLALALYGFLCLALWMIWQDLKQAGIQSIQPKVPPLRVEVVTRGAAPFARAFTQPEVTVGRDPVCELRVEDEAISARHAKFSFHHGQWWIEDLHSRNGTNLNQTRLKTPTVLTTGDEVRCGLVTLLVRLDGELTATQTVASEVRHD